MQRWTWLAWPLVAVGIGIVCALLITVAVAQPICLLRKDIVDISLQQDADVLLFRRPIEVARANGFMARNGGSPNLAASAVLYVFYRSIDRAEVFFLVDDKACGRNRTNADMGRKFLDFVTYGNSWPA